MKRQDIVNTRLQALIQNHEKHKFPAFLYLLRNNLRLTRDVVADETDLSSYRLLCLEQGKNINTARIAEINVLADYYNIEFDLLMRKAQDYFHPIKHEKIA